MARADHLPSTVRPVRSEGSPGPNSTRAEANAEPEALFERRGAAGIITLNRPKALNAFTLAAVRAIRSRLADWAADPAVTRVVIRSNSERAFSAGGDVRRLYDLHRAGRTEEALAFWREEYVLNAAIKSFPKPYVALIDGICMGGGVGLSLHGSYRVAGDRYLFAMPEVAIGFFPDVGATFALPRLRGGIGTYLVLTAARLGPGEGCAAGLATHRVPSARFPALLDALTEDLAVRGILAAFSERPEASSLAPHAALIEGVFSADTVEDILEKLDRASERGGASASFAKAQAAAIRRHSPLSLKIALEQMRRGPELDFAGAMRTEFRIVSRMAYGHDFYEGVRAALVDKDDAPRWSPGTLADVTRGMVERHFAPLPAGRELPL